MWQHRYEAQREIRRHKEAKRRFEREKEEKETEKKEGELCEKERKRERINKKNVCDECIRIDTIIRHIGSKNTVLL